MKSQKNIKTHQNKLSHNLDKKNMMIEKIQNEFNDKIENEEFKINRCPTKKENLKPKLKINNIKKADEEKNNNVNGDSNKKEIAGKEKEDKQKMVKNPKSTSYFKFFKDKKKNNNNNKSNNVSKDISTNKKSITSRKKTPGRASPQKSKNTKKNIFLGDKTPKREINNYNNLINFEKNDDNCNTIVINKMVNSPSMKKFRTNSLYINTKNLINDKNIDKSKKSDKLPWGWGGNLTNKNNDAPKKIKYNYEEQEIIATKFDCNKIKKIDKLSKSPKSIKTNNNNNNDLNKNSRNVQTNEVQRKRGLSSYNTLSSSNKFKK